MNEHRVITALLLIYYPNPIIEIHSRIVLLEIGCFRKDIADIIDSPKIQKGMEGDVLEVA
ncbi:hypothetical protein KC799_27440 [candidate division KSB1 bacterium]|nr:hypothetical protein [candidate division KSB1 bacterium]